MLLNAYFSRAHQVPVSDAKESRSGEPILIRSVAAPHRTLIIIGGIVTGIVTPTESSARRGLLLLAVFLHQTAHMA
jgi:TRAP-type C4-dicarboxylate transport system permease large subunit